jgi:hypothetical protein
MQSYLQLVQSLSSFPCRSWPPHSQKVADDDPDKPYLGAYLAFLRLTRIFEAHTVRYQFGSLKKLLLERCTFQNPTEITERDILDFLKEKSRLIEELKLVDINLPENILPLVVLVGLPSELDPYLLDFHSKSSLQIEELRASLRSLFSSKPVIKRTIRDPSANFTTESDTRDRNRKIPSAKRLCTFCERTLRCMFS